jgi:hypothetical protein
MEGSVSGGITAQARAQLAHQALGRPLNALEAALAQTLEEIFTSGQHDLGVVVTLLQQKGVKRPSGAAGAWSLEALASELAQINAALDEAYASGATASFGAPS